MPIFSRRDSIIRTSGPGPALKPHPWPRQIVLDAKLVEDSGDYKINEVLNATGLVVKAGHGGKDYRSGFGSFQHVCEVNTIERRFTGDKY